MTRTLFPPEVFGDIDPVEVVVVSLEFGAVVDLLPSGRPDRLRGTFAPTGNDLRDQLCEVHSALYALDDDRPDRSLAPGRWQAVSTSDIGWVHSFA